MNFTLNPEGPDNNEPIGGFKFNNPTLGNPKAYSDDFWLITNEFTWVRKTKHTPLIGEKWRTSGYANVAVRGSKVAPLRTTWGKPAPILDPRAGFPAHEREPHDEVSKYLGYDFIEDSLYGFRKDSPIFDMEAFTHDQGAKFWDLHIKSV